MITQTMIRHAIEYILSPFCIGIVLYTALLFLLFKRCDHQGLRIGFCVIFIGFLLFSTGWLPNALMSRLAGQYSVVTTINPSIHWIVVLGGGQAGDVEGPPNHALNVSSINRLVEGVRLYRGLPGSKLILSGGGEVDETRSEAAHSGVLASWFGIPRQDVILETSSINTADEAVAIKQLLHQEPFYLVTSAVHMPRAMALCQKQGLNPIAAPSDYFFNEQLKWYQNIVPRPINFVNTCGAWHEILGWMWGRIRGQI